MEEYFDVEKNIRSVRLHPVRINFAIFTCVKHFLCLRQSTGAFLTYVNVRSEKFNPSLKNQQRETHEAFTLHQLEILVLCNYTLMR